MGILPQIVFAAIFTAIRSISQLPDNNVATNGPIGESICSLSILEPVPYSQDPIVRSGMEKTRTKKTARAMTGRAGTTYEGAKPLGRQLSGSVLVAKVNFA